MAGFLGIALTRVPSGNGSVRWYSLLTCSRRMTPSSSSHSVITAVSHVKTTLFRWKLMWISCLSTSGRSKLTTSKRPSVDSRKFELYINNFWDYTACGADEETYIDFCLFTDFGAEMGGDSMIGTCIARWSLTSSSWAISSSDWTLGRSLAILRSFSKRMVPHNWSRDWASAGGSTSSMVDPATLGCVYRARAIFLAWAGILNPWISRRLKDNRYRWPPEWLARSCRLYGWQH